MTETSLFDRTGHPRVYIADDGSIYTWNGRAVAYVDGQNVYGWQGKHIGFFVDGILYDLRGRRVGFTRDNCPAATYPEWEKDAKVARPAKYRRHAAHARPALSTGYSDEELEAFVSQDGPDGPIVRKDANGTSE
jgi:hypothetical protein